jgi:branched-chain amino acid transport system permease protein
VTAVLQDIVSAISLGALYALLALAISLIFGIANVLNFAHGEIIMVASYVLLLVAGAAWPLVTLAVVATAIVLALLMERLMFRPVRGASASTLFIVAFAGSQLLQNVVSLIAGATPRSTTFAAALNAPLHVLGLTVTKLDVVTLGVCGALLAAGALLLKRSTFGLQLRVAAEDFTMARMLGVRANAVMVGAFALSGLMGGIAAELLIARTGSLTPTLGVQPVLIAFVAAVVGGLGRLSGAAIGGLFLGALTVTLQVTLPPGAQGYQDAFLYGGVIVLLLFRPEGLLPSAKRGQRI